MQLVQVYCNIVRSVLEYACPVWAALPKCLDDAILLDWICTKKGPYASFYCLTCLTCLSNLTIMQLVQVYCSVVRSVLEYPCPVWAALPKCVDDATLLDWICTKKGPTHRSTVTMTMPYFNMASLPFPTPYKRLLNRKQ